MNRPQLMVFSDDQLRHLAQGHPAGNAWPYCGGSPEDIEKHLRYAVACIKSTKLVDVDAGFDHYGSGYASYVHVFCEKKGGASRTKHDVCDWIDGIAVYLSRLTPYAVYGYEQRTRHATGGSGSFIELSKLVSLPPGDWHQELAAICDSLAKVGFLFPGRDELLQRLPFKLFIPTIFDSEYMFDVLFYWED